MIPISNNVSVANTVKNKSTEFDRGEHHESLMRIHDHVQRAMILEAPLRESLTDANSSFDVINHKDIPVSGSISVNKNPLATEDKAKIKRQLSAALLRLSGADIDY